MGLIVKISKNNSAQETKKALEELSRMKAREKPKTLRDFFGKLPGAFGEGLEYQKKSRNEWQ